ncbi:nucleotidyl transferase AbiEii/AbiGii toxin family protein [bacterium]|nr:nucleotidyl transferase AbiEii/AbiGii toxin family protein [bacterium]
MISKAHITAWRQTVPWALDTQVEQDLVISRALVELFSDPLLQKAVAFRGGTALHKLFLQPPGRYSEDIDLVQVDGQSIGPVLDAIHARLDFWLGKPQWKQGAGRATLYYRFESELPPVTTLKLKVEINTREHFTVLGHQSAEYSVDSPWFKGKSQILTYRAEELLGTKLRALYQRKKGRDLFDLSEALTRISSLDSKQVLECFNRYVAHDGTTVSRAEFEANLFGKISDPIFLADVPKLLAGGFSFDPLDAHKRVQNALVKHLPGEPWKGKKK